MKQSLERKTDGGHAFPTQSWEYDGGDRVPAVVRENVEAMTYLQDFHDAGTQRARESRRKELSRLGIDTSGPHWQAWIDMGEPS